MLYCFDVFNPTPFTATTPPPNVTIILLHVFSVVQILTTFFTPCLHSLLFPFAITCPPRASSGISFSKGLSLITCLGFCLKSDLGFLIFDLFPALVPISLHCLHRGVFSFFGWVPHPFRKARRHPLVPYWLWSTVSPLLEPQRDTLLSLFSLILNWS